MVAAYDQVIIGGGHNGLTCAAYLARAGRKVLVLEARHVLGGGAVEDEAPREAGRRRVVASVAPRGVEALLLDELRGDITHRAADAHQGEDGLAPRCVEKAHDRDEGDGGAEHDPETAQETPG